MKLCRYLLFGLLLGCESAAVVPEHVPQEEPVTEDSIDGRTYYCELNASQGLKRLLVDVKVADNDGVKTAGVTSSPDFSWGVFSVSPGCSSRATGFLYYLDELAISESGRLWFFYEDCDGNKKGLMLEENCDF